LAGEVAELRSLVVDGAAEVVEVDVAGGISKAAEVSIVEVGVDLAGKAVGVDRAEVKVVDSFSILKSGFDATAKSTVNGTGEGLLVVDGAVNLLVDLGGNTVRVAGKSSGRLLIVVVDSFSQTVGVLGQLSTVLADRLDDVIAVVNGDTKTGSFSLEEISGSLWVALDHVANIGKESGKSRSEVVEVVTEFSDREFELVALFSEGPLVVVDVEGQGVTMLDDWVFLVKKRAEGRVGLISKVAEALVVSNCGSTGRSLVGEVLVVLGRGNSEDSTG